MKPLSDRVRKIERELDRLRTELGRHETALADNDLYTAASRKEELTGLLRAQAGLKSEIESLETAWLEASELLDQAESEADI